MISTYFYYPNGAYKILRNERPLSRDIVSDLANDFKTALAVSKPPPPKVKKDVKEMLAIHNAKANYKKGLDTEGRNAILRQILSHNTPNFGSFKLTIL